MIEEFVTKRYFDEKMEELKIFILSKAEQPKNISVGQASKLLGKSRTAIYNMIDAGSLVAKQISPKKKEITYASVMMVKDQLDRNKK